MNEQQYEKMRSAPGFVAALDQSDLRDLRTNAPEE